MTAWPAAAAPLRRHRDGAGMSLSLILQALQAGITNGFIYALVGMGLAVIFRGSRVINVMHGEFSVVGAWSPC